MVSQVAALWFLLVTFAVYTTGWLVIPAMRQRARDAAKLREATVLRRVRLFSLAEEVTRYAGEVEVAAERAAEMEVRRRAMWRAERTELAAAEQAFDAADAAWRRLAFAAACPMPDDADPAERLRHLRRIVIEACMRGDLSPLALGDALARRDGWDPRRPLADQELQLRKMIREHRQAILQRAAERERAAWQAYVAGAEPARCLRNEAHAAADRVTAALVLLAPVRQPQPTGYRGGTATQVLGAATGRGVVSYRRDTHPRMDDLRR